MSRSLDARHQLHFALRVFGGRKIWFKRKNGLGGGGAFRFVGRNAERVHSKRCQAVANFLQIMVKVFKLFAAVREFPENVVAGNRAFLAGGVVVIEQAGNLA